MTGLRVVSYNVHSSRDDRDALADVVRELRPDVLVVQEGPRRFRWRHRTAALARSFDLVVAEGGLHSLGNLLLTSLRVRVLASRSVRYPLTPGRHMRGAAIATCAVEGVRFAVAGTHLSTDPQERPAQARQFREAVAGLDAPLVAGVDVNEGPAGGTAWNVLAEGMVDVAERTGAGNRHTFPVAHPYERIDALFVDPRIEVRGYRVVDTPAARRASDHFAIVADLTLPGPGANPA
ncbi:endonuclease/exonuclease/phosphatase family protein [Rhizomonospora bruguierae]|uniref:endonuclease/exonuclease/phosphatase family protein n=1 Tax=Rhizomonospora bruguierae TaxID=1581705 RepID=UPI001BD17736|nr:endonuclease/exonuclease/phosphatase family protein [Micromonospora sp. NBRC 107566]